MMRIFIVFSFLLVFQLPSFCQDDLVRQGFSIGVTPSALLNKWTGFQGKVAYTYKDFELEMNIGSLSGSDEGEPYSGLRIRPVVKYYFSETGDTKYYFGLGGLHRKLNIEAVGTFGRFNNSFFQEFDFEITQSMNGYYGMFGILIPFSNDRFFFDGGIGFGSSRITTEHSGAPNDAVLIYTPPFFSKDTRSAGVTSYPIAFYHLAIMFRFG